MDLIQPEIINNVTRIYTGLNDFGLIAALINSYKKEVIVFGEKIGVGKPNKSNEVKDQLKNSYKFVVEKGNFFLGHN